MEKSVGGLNKEFGKLALEALTPAFQGTTQLARATKEFISDGSLAGEYTKELVRSVTAIGTLTAGVKGFGMAWEFVAGDAVKQASSLKEVLTSLPSSIKVTITAIAIAQIARAGVAAYEAYQAGQQQKNAEADLKAQNDKLLPEVQKMIDDAETSGKIAPRQADEWRTKLSIASQGRKYMFTPSAEEQALSEMYVPPYQTSQAPDQGALSDAMRSIRFQLTGTGSDPRTGENALNQESQQAIDLRKRGLEELQKLEEELNAKTLEGFAQQRAEAEKAYNDTNKLILNTAHKGGISYEDPKVMTDLQLNESKYQERVAEIDAAERQKKEEDQRKLIDLQQQFTIEGLDGLQKEIAMENARYERAQAAIKAAKEFTDAEKANLLQLNDTAHQNALNGMNRGQVEAGRNVNLQLNAQNPWELETIKINEEYEKRKKDLIAYYDWQLQQAQDEADKEEALENQKQAALAKLEQQRATATSQTDGMIGKIGVFAENQFASGMSSAFMSIIQGTKSAGEAFKEFAGQFLSSIAQMIMQTIILAEVQSLVRGLGGTGQAAGMPAGDGGAFAPVEDASGGIHMRRAAAGIMLAAAGIQGVSAINSPTYFPKFNVLAGEAGSEMLTVLSRPSTMSINGVPAAVGNVGPDKIAVMSLDNLSRMVQTNNPRAMADGGFAGVLNSNPGSTSARGNSGLSVTRQSPQEDGRILVELSPHPAYEARIIENSVQSARAHVAQDFMTDSPIRRNAKDALA